MTLLLMFAQTNCSMDNTLNMQCVRPPNRHATQPRPLGISQAGKNDSEPKEDQLPFVSLCPACCSDGFL